RRVLSSSPTTRGYRTPRENGEVLAGAPLDDGNVDARQRQLARQHQPCRTSSGDHHRTLGHRHTSIGTSGTPTRASSSARSGGAHTRTSAPRVRNCTASPAIGLRSPRDPYVDNTRISQLPFPPVLASAGDAAARPGPYRKPPGSPN